MTSKEEIPVQETSENKSANEKKEVSELPPPGTSLHKRRRGEPPATLTVKAPQTPSDAEGSSPFTAGLSPNDWSTHDDITDPETYCLSMIQRLKGQDDPLSKIGRASAMSTLTTITAIDQLEKLLALLNELVTLKERNNQILKKMRDVEHLKKLFESRKKIREEAEKLKKETIDLRMINEAFDADYSLEYGQVLLDNMLSGTRSMKRSGSKWRSHKFGSSLLRKQRSRSAGGEDSDAYPGTPLRRRSEGIFCKEVDKSKVSKWTRVKAAFKWEKAHMLNIGGAAGAVAAGALVGAVALAGSAPSSAPATLSCHELREPSLTPRSAMSFTPNSSCEELRMETGTSRRNFGLRDENDNSFLQTPTLDDSSTSPSPNKMHKTPWGKMRDILSTHRESVRKKTRNKSSPDVIPRRRSFSDGAESDAPPVLTLTIPSSEELETDPHPHVLRKQRSLELSARPPQHRPPRPSKWSKVKKAFLTSTSASVPSSPNRHSAFFTDAETEAFSSGCEASSGVREEIARDYAALQSRLTREFSDRRGQLYAESRPVATEEQLSADFRKKLAEWQRMKGVRQPPPVPARQDLSDDFLKRWDEWKRMKETNSVPAWEEEAKPEEVLVQTSTGLFRFQGISRSFTRKLHEWEKSRGIAPEASTSALLKAAKTRNKVSHTTLTRTQSDGSVAPSTTGSERLHASSLSVNDADQLDLEYGEHQYMSNPAVVEEDPDDEDVRGAVLVEVEAEEVCTAAPLVAMSPQHTPQKPVYTYGEAEARHLCETSSAISGTAVMQSNESKAIKKKDKNTMKNKIPREQVKTDKGNSKRKLVRQVSLEEDAKFIRKTIEEIERGSSSRLKDDDQFKEDENEDSELNINTDPCSSKSISEGIKQGKSEENENETKDLEFKDLDKSLNSKKKSKSRARLERELSKPSESDTEHDVDTVTVEIPRRRKRLRRPSEKPKTPPTSIHSDSEQEIFVLKIKAPEPREGSPEVIVKTTRKIFSPVVRCGETVPRAVIPLDVEDLVEAKANETKTKFEKVNENRNITESAKIDDNREREHPRTLSSGDLPETEVIKFHKKERPPLPLSPTSQRKKETAPSIRIMIQRYNMKINEEGHTSGASSGTSSPAWRSPAAERRRPPDMPVGVNIRNNPFLEREVQKSASACQLSRRDPNYNDKRLSPTPENLDGVPKSHSANALHFDNQNTKQESKEHIIELSRPVSTHAYKRGNTFSEAEIVIEAPDITRNLPNDTNLSKSKSNFRCNDLSQLSSVPVLPANAVGQKIYDRSISLAGSSTSDGGKVSERTAKIREAREKFLTSAVLLRRDGISSASDLRRGDRSNRVSCDSDMIEPQTPRDGEENPLNRSASTGMVNVDRDAWERVASGRKGRSSKFSLARLAAKLRRKEEGAVSRLCRQSLLVHLKNK